MSEYDDQEEYYDDDLIKDDVSSGRNADPRSSFESLIPAHLHEKFEIFSYRGAATLLSQNYPDEFSQIVDALTSLEITKTMIRTPGGSKGPIAKYVDTLFGPEWQETRISADLHVNFTMRKGTCF